MFFGKARNRMSNRKTYEVDACTLWGYILWDGDRLAIASNKEYRALSSTYQIEAIAQQFLGRYVKVTMEDVGPPIDLE